MGYFPPELMEKDMMNEPGNRTEWEFTYTASKLAVGAEKQKAHRLRRVQVWKKAKEDVMNEIRTDGIQITESMADMLSNTHSTYGQGPQVSLKPELHRKLTECYNKIKEHEQAAEEYDGWIQVLQANPETQLKLTHADWLYFFGRV